MKKISLIIGILLVGFLIWYLVIKPHDYLISFKVKANSGTINQSLKIWNSSLEKNTPIQQEKLTSLVQKIYAGDSIHIYNWKIEALNDSISKVKIYVKDQKYSFQNKVSTPFIYTDFEKRTKNTVTDFFEKLSEELKKIKIKVEGESETKSTYCAYVSLKDLQVRKAAGMMNNYSLLNSVLFNKNVKSNGTPFIEVTDWNIEKDSLEYNFCFPIIYSDSLPENKFIKYKQYGGIKAIKAIYNGNYITSDRAWYALLEYAERKNIKVSKTPIEFFYNNPNFGGDETKWKAEIYMPIINK